MSEESPEQKWSRLQERIRKAILETYPNPNREGCPGSDVLLDMAMRAAETATLEGDARWQHVTHCAPCYREFLGLRETLRHPGSDTP
jgi:hypothetical protein